MNRFVPFIVLLLSACAPAAQPGNVDMAMPDRPAPDMSGWCSLDPDQGKLCTTSIMCSGGEGCFESRCRQLCGGPNNACPRGSRCCGGMGGSGCVPGAQCCVASDCDGGLACLCHQCLPCRVDVDCGPGLVCGANRRCRKPGECTNEFDCRGGEMCDLSDRICRKACAREGNCGAGEHCCGGFCYAGACVGTLAGNGLMGSNDAPTASALIGAWLDLAVDDEGAVYGSDRENNGLRVYNNTGHLIGGVPAGSVGQLVGRRFGCHPDPMRNPADPKEEMGTIAGIARDPETRDFFLADTTFSVLWRVKADGTSVTVFAGACGERGSKEGRGSDARFYMPSGLTFDRNGKMLYMTDLLNRVYSIDKQTQEVKEIAGAMAGFSSPAGIDMDTQGRLFVGEWGAPNLRMLERDRMGGQWKVTTLKGPGMRVPFIRFAQDNRLFASSDTSIIEVTVDATQGTAKTERMVGGGGFAGIGVNRDHPERVWFGGLFGGYTLSFADIGGGQFNMSKTPVAGQSNMVGIVDGPGTEATFDMPLVGDIRVDGASVATDKAGNVWVAEPTTHRIRFITPDGKVSSIGSGVRSSNPLGVDVAPDRAQFFWPTGITVDKDGNAYVVDRAGRVLFIDAKSHHVTTAGSTIPLDVNMKPEIYPPWPTSGAGMVMNSHGDLLFSTDYMPNSNPQYGTNYLRLIIRVPLVQAAAPGAPPKFGRAEVYAGKRTMPTNDCKRGGVDVGEFGGAVLGMAMDNGGVLYVANSACGLMTVSNKGEIQQVPVIGPGGGAPTFLFGLAMASPQTLYATTGADRHALYSIDISSGKASHVVGEPPTYANHYQDGRPPSARFWMPGSIATDPKGNVVLADWRNNRIRVLYTR